MAGILSAQFGRTVNAGWVRKQLHLARKRFAAHLLDAIAQTLEDSSPERIEEELIDLGLLEACRTALDHRRRTR